jgi:hypothetical protein
VHAVRADLRAAAMRRAARVHSGSDDRRDDPFRPPGCPPGPGDPNRDQARAVLGGPVGRSHPKSLPHGLFCERVVSQVVRLRATTGIGRVVFFWYAS